MAKLTKIVARTRPSRLRDNGVGAAEDGSEWRRGRTRGGDAGHVGAHYAGGLCARAVSVWQHDGGQRAAGGLHRRSVCGHPRAVPARGRRSQPVQAHAPGLPGPAPGARATRVHLALDRCQRRARQLLGAPAPGLLSPLALLSAPCTRSLPLCSYALIPSLVRPISLSCSLSRADTLASALAGKRVRRSELF